MTSSSRSSNAVVAREDTPLLTAVPVVHHHEGGILDPLDDFDDDDTIGNASVRQTITNIAKTCCGTGCLVLPYSARQGGLLLHIFGLAFIACWNVYTVQRLCQCLEYLPAHQITTTTTAGSVGRNNKNNKTSSTTAGASIVEDSNQSTDRLQQQQHPPEGTAMFGKVVWYAMGPVGLVALDILMLSFLCGILVTYINAMRSFLRNTPLTTNSDVMDALALVAIMGPLSSVPHMGYLSKASGIGLIVLAATFVVIGAYGMTSWWSDENVTSTATIVTYSLTWFPQDGLWGISHWFGCIAFSFGVAPLCYDYRKSMADPSQMVVATGWALSGVALTYMVVGIGFWKLFPHLDSDLLQELPTTGLLPIVTRLAMVVVVLTTAPLLIVPCGELLEGKVSHFETCQRFSEDQHPYTRRVFFRFGIALLGAGISILCPGFVNVLSFVGCCCVACLGFTIPSLLHGLLCFQARHERPMNKVAFAIDVIMLAWGVFATVVSTSYTFRQLSIAPEPEEASS